MKQSPIPLKADISASDRGVSLVRAIGAFHFAAARRESIHDVAAQRLRGDPVGLALVERATSVASTIGGDGAALVAAQSSAFLASLAPASAAAALIARGVSISIDTRGEFNAPLHMGGTPAMVWTGEGHPIAVSSVAFEGLPITARKLGLITVMSRELSQRAAAMTIFATILRESAAKSLDAAYFSDDAGSDVAVAGLLYDLAPLTPQTGSGVDGMRADLAELAAAVCGTGSSGEVVFIGSQARAARADILDPANRGLILPSAAVPADRVIAVDPRSIVHGFGPDLDINTSTEAVLHMESATPAAIVSGAPATAAPVASMFQTDSLATRALLDVGFVKRRADAVAYVDGLNAW